jgi:hypothetical protein
MIRWRCGFPKTPVVLIPEDDREIVASELSG